MPFTLDQLEFLGVHVGVAIPPAFIENKRRAEEFKQRRAKLDVDYPDLADHHFAEAIRTVLAEADDLAAAGVAMDGALQRLDRALSLIEMPPPPAEPPPPPPPVEPEQPEAEAREIFAEAKESPSGAPKPLPEKRGLPKLPVDAAKMTQGKRLGKGSFGDVYEIESEPGGPPLVIKMIEKEGGEADLTAEAEAYAKIGEHDNIAKCYGIHEVAGKKGMVMEKIDGGGLDSVFNDLQKLKKSGKLSHEEYWGSVQHMMHGTLKGLAQMESAGMVHNDMKANNVMFDFATGQPKVIDFGLSKATDEPIELGGQNPVYSAPEKIGTAGGGKVGASPKQDAFSAGVMLHKEGEGEAFKFGREQLGHPMMAFMAAEEYASPDAEGAAKTALKPAKPGADAAKPGKHAEGYQTEYVKFLNALLHPDPKQRLSAADALNHPFLKDALAQDPALVGKALDKVKESRAAEKGKGPASVPAPDPGEIKRRAEAALKDQQAIQARKDSILDLIKAAETARTQAGKKGGAISMEEVRTLGTQQTDLKQAQDTLAADQQKVSDAIKELSGFYDENRRVLPVLVAKDKKTKLAGAEAAQLDALQKQVAEDDKARTQLLDPMSRLAQELIAAQKQVSSAAAAMDKFLGAARAADPAAGKASVGGEIKANAQKKVDDEQRTALEQRHLKLKPDYQQALLVQTVSTDRLKSLDQTLLAQIQDKKWEQATKTIAALEVEVSRTLVAKANEEKQGTIQQAIIAGPSLGDAATLFPARGTSAWKKQADRGITKGGKGKEFGAVIKAWEAVEKSAVKKNLAALEKAARAYIADYDSRADDEKDDTSKFKYDKCKEALQNVRRLRLQQERDEFPLPPWDNKTEAAARALQSQVCLETGSGKDNESRGASESYWINDAAGKKAFIFKPADGEADPSYGWKKGGGAAREVMMSSLNEDFKASLGLDFGVSRTSLAALESDSLKGEKAGNNTRRTGAVQEFAPADGALTKGVQDQDPAVLATIPPEETQKVLLMDFVTLQLDRQPNNFLVNKDDNGSPKLVPIDAGNALPSKKAFAAMRRSFINNAAFAMPGGDQPFSDDMKEKIAALDEKKIVAGMAAANKTMAAVDPATKDMVDDESMEATRRSVLLLKKAAAAKPPLTTKAIGELYAFYFHKVLEAKDRGVDKAIDDVLKEYAANQGLIAQIDAIPNGRDQLREQGWPSDQYENLRSEEPARLLAILQKRQVNPVVQKQMNDMIKQLGGKAKLGFNPDQGTYDSRLGKLRTALKEKEDARRESDPKLKKAVAAQKIDFKVELPGGKFADMSAAAKMATLRRLEEYEAAGGDKGLKKKIKQNPAKLTFEQKVYERLGGDARLKEMEELGLNPYLSKKLADRIEELEYMNEFEALGGLDTYVRLGGPQNAQLSMFSRLEIMRNLKRLEE